MTQPFYARRALYYATGLYRSQLSKGEGYDSLKPVVGIHVLLFDLWPEQEQPHSVFELRERSSHTLLTEDLSLSPSLIPATSSAAALA